MNTLKLSQHGIKIGDQEVKFARVQPSQREKDLEWANVGAGFIFFALIGVIIFGYILSLFR